MSIARCRAFATVLILIVAGLDRTAGQQPQPPQVRTITGGAEPVSIDFYVLARDGAPVTDLKLEEVTIRIDGRTRSVKSLKYIPAIADAAGVIGEPPPPPFATNTVTESGRQIVLVVDDSTLRVGNEPPLKSAIGTFLQNLPPRDQVAFVTLPYGSIKVNLTTDRDAIRQPVGILTGQAPQTESITDAACRTRTSLQALTGVMEVFGRTVGPTTFVFFTSSMMGPRSAVMTSAASGGGVSNIGMCELLPEEFQHVAAAAAASHVNLYIVQHDAMVATSMPTAATAPSRGSDSPRAGIENLAGVTGGTMLALAGAAGETALSRIIRETGGYYLATIEAEPNERAGGSHQLGVRVSRDGVSVRNRPDVIIGRAGEASRPTATKPEALVSDMRSYTELPVRLAAYSVRNQGDGQIKIVAIAEPADPSVNVTAAAAGLYDQRGRLAAQWIAQPSDLGNTSLRMAMLAPTGSYRLRVAVTDPSGRRGTADYDLTAELMPAGPLKLSSIVLGLSRNGDFVPRLQFGPEPVVLALFEIYGGQAGARVSVILEVSQTLNGPAFLQMPAAVSRTSEEDKFEVLAAIPIGALPPGDYVVRAIVNLEGQAEGRVVRTLRKTGQ
jgi:VWFA-related protein